MDFNDLRIILQSNISLLVIETFDELRAQTLLQQYFRSANTAMWRWSVSDGLQPLGFGLHDEALAKLREPEKVLEHIKSQQSPGVFVLCDFHPYLDEPRSVRLLKDIALNQQAASHRVIMVSHRVDLPPELTRYAARMSMALPTEAEILAMIREEAKDWSRRHSDARVKTDNLTLQKLVNNLKGLPHRDVKRLARGAIADDGAISDDDLPEVAKAKFALMDMAGVLHFEFSTAHLNDVAGLQNLKQWLAHRREAILCAGESRSVDLPKGVLLFGVQGGGKSLAAKAIAGIWGLPLLRLDMGALFDKFVGETERKLREALRLADIMAPCVLWMDEVEKSLAQSDHDSALPKRLLGTLLTWMAERKSAVFAVATSNNIHALPPELVRKGRFDEIFFVDLPDTLTREAIFRIHMVKRDIPVAQFDLNALAQLADGFTGAEIEQALVSALYAASAQGEVLGGHHVESALVNTRPLSTVMAEPIQALRAWAAERALPAG